MNAAWQQREDVRRHLRAEPHSSSFRKVVKMAGKKLRKVRKAAVVSFFWDFVRKLETRSREGDQAGFYKHLNGDPALRRRLLDIVVRIWGGVRCRSSGNMPSS